MRRTQILFWTGVITIMTSADLARAQGVGPGQQMVLKGTLQGGMMGIGGESTGFMLEGVSVEADLSEVDDAGDLAGQQVLIRGYFDVKQYVERGPVWLFHATGAKLASDTSPFAPSVGQTAGGGESDQVRSQALALLRSDPAFREEVRKALKAADAAPASQ